VTEETDGQTDGQTVDDGIQTVDDGIGRANARQNWPKIGIVFGAICDIGFITERYVLAIVVAIPSVCLSVCRSVVLVHCG